MVLKRVDLLLIQFKVIRYKNFLSTGNLFIEVFLDRNKTTLIVGKNGHGKSTLPEAIVYGLYGKPYRDINKPQLINSITNKDMLVEVEFLADRNKFLIRRGMRPTVFEIWKNGTLLEQNAALKDYQEYLEKNILKMNFKTFTQIAILGSTDYIPFMRLQVGERRKLIEDLLDIRIFSIMNAILKVEYNKNKDDIKDTEYKLALLKQKLIDHKKHAKSLKQNNTDLISAKEKLIEDLKSNITQAQIDSDLLSEEADKLLTKSITESLQKKKSEILDLEKDLESKRIKVVKELKFLEEYDSCPTCKQDLDEAWKHRNISKKHQRKQDLEEGLVKLATKIETINKKLEEDEKLLIEFKNLTNKLSEKTLDIRSWSKSIETITQEIKLLTETTTQISDTEADIKSYNKKLKELTEEKEQFISARELMDISSVMLKDTGIKTRVIKQYIPIINKIVNKYLSSLDFFVNFELDESFKETIKSRFRDEFTYSSFSAGEKFRIDLSLLFAWRAVAKMRNNSSTNLLIMDEVLDAVLDSNGVEDLLKILNTLENQNVFVISHRGAEIQDKFAHTIEFEKISNFSRIKR